jgi:hypothetical protein
MRTRSDRRRFLQILAGSAVSVVSARLFAQPEWVDPPSTETAQEAGLIDAAIKELDRAVAPSSVLCDARYLRVHPFPRFRAAIKAHATSAPLAIAAKTEPGERMTLTLALVDKAGKPLANALVYLYQTSAKGWYADTAYHVRANSGDARHARLFGYVRTTKAGLAEIQTIRPGGYPDGDLPQHVHVEVIEPGHERVTEVVFSDDPRLTPAAKQRSIQHGFGVGDPVKAADGTWRVRATITVP